jgi:hypothetical protein
MHETYQVLLLWVLGYNDYKVGDKCREIGNNGSNLCHQEVASILILSCLHDLVYLFL